MTHSHRVSLDSLPPQLRPLVRASATRRSVLRGGVAAGVLGAVGVGSACGTGGSSDAAASLSAAKDLSADEKVVNWANWTAYIDLADDGVTSPTLEAFQDESGLTVTYKEDIEDNASYFGKVQGQLANGQDIGQDIIVFTDWMAARCIRLGYAQSLDAAAIPNKANILDDLANVDFDPGRTKSLTWQSGFGLVAWNKEKVPGGIATISDLWRPELKGRVEVLSEMRDTIGLIMMEQGVDISSADWGDDEFNAALDVLKAQIDSGQIRQVKGNGYREDLISEDALAVIGWSGDIVSANFDTDDKFGFAIPESGGTLWSDNMLVPIGSPHKANAEALMDHYYDPEVAAKVAAYVTYITPVKGAQEAMAELDPSLVDNQLIFPNADTLATVKVFRTLTAEEETTYNDAFQKVIGN